MKTIKLTRGYYALVDDKNFEQLNQWKWYTLIDSSKKIYAVRNDIYIKNKKRKIIWMHRLIMNTPKNMETDHRDSNGLNNQIRNLRIVTRIQNSSNRKLNKNNMSGYKGVNQKYWNRWQASISVKGKLKYLGLFKTAHQAALAYDLWAKDIYGEFALLNFRKAL